MTTTEKRSKFANNGRSAADYARVVTVERDNHPALSRRAAIEVTVVGMTFRCICSKSTDGLYFDLGTLIGRVPSDIPMPVVGRFDDHTVTGRLWRQICKEIHAALTVLVGCHLSPVRVDLLDLEGSES